MRRKSKALHFFGAKGGKDLSLNEKRRKQQKGGGSRNRAGAAPLLSLFVGAHYVGCVRRACGLPSAAGGRRSLYINKERGKIMGQTEQRENAGERGRGEGEKRGKEKEGR